ncbi:MAG: hydroxymethylbilane synthase [Fibrobacter sp.]|nr:hydroxymethylbilane synthase [Fibrobacter sp.]
MKLRIATRKSALALAQTTMAADEIVAANRGCKNVANENAAEEKIAEDNVAGENCADLSYELVSMTTEGDRRLDKSLASFGGKGVFIKELEVALLEGRADIAIHSLKDMPAEVLPEFKLAAVLKREDPRDAFLARGGKDGSRFMDLPAGAKVGTGSIRRVVQLKALRPDLEYVPIRGNIQTRISKLSELDGVVLAAAGLKRMGLADQVTEYFDTDKMLPASGQGILAIETLKDGCAPEVTAALNRVNHLETYCIAVAEMAFLKALDAGCQFPVASFAEIADAGVDAADVPTSECAGNRVLKIRGIYWDEATKRLLRAEDSAAFDVAAVESVQKAKQLGVSLAELIKKQLNP